MGRRIRPIRDVEKASLASKADRIGFYRVQLKHLLRSSSSELRVHSCSVVPRRPVASRVYTSLHKSTSSSSRTSIVKRTPRVQLVHVLLVPRLAGHREPAVTTEPPSPSPPLSAYALSTTYRTTTRTMRTSGYKLMALAAVVAGASGQSVNGMATGLAPPRQTARGPPATQEDAEPTDGERGVEDGACALYGDTMFALTALCKWVLATDHAGGVGQAGGADRFVLTMGAGAGAADGGGYEGEEGLGACPCPCPRREAPRAQCRRRHACTLALSAAAVLFLILSQHPVTTYSYTHTHHHHNGGPVAARRRSATPRPSTHLPYPHPRLRVACVAPPPDRQPPPRQF